ncbi:uncharacterized protein LOC119766008 [Culex quinquefasciatus]|uniref:uncharacterized protein LOC119766008 n=1 Tax=Culex quinquefasciatus TaxID=7176 RepID=UPI0018E3427A|nr:uncharacterized protein LOC119766008 [Culex quinquefasciatus]
MKFAVSICVLAILSVTSLVQGAATSVSSLMCTGAGLYPDPYDCNAYHVCSAKKRASEPRRCPAGYGFQYTSASSTDAPCKQLTSGSECLTIQCDPQRTFQPYDPANQFYASCIGSTIYVYRCADGASFNGYGCYFECPGEGVYQNSAEPTTYYLCGADLSYHTMYCPKNAVMPGDMELCAINF